MARCDAEFYSSLSVALRDAVLRFDRCNIVTHGLPAFSHIADTHSQSQIGYGASLFVIVRGKKTLSGIVNTRPFVSHVE